MQLVQETKNLVRLTRFGMVNCFLAREDDGFTLIDTGVAGSAPGIREAAQSLGAPIRRILLTHAHIDHVGSLDALVREYPGMEFALGQRESRLLRKDFSLDAGETGKTLVGFPGAKSQPTRHIFARSYAGSLCFSGYAGWLSHFRRCFYHADWSACRRNIQTSLSVSCFVFVEP